MGNISRKPLMLVASIEREDEVLRGSSQHVAFAEEVLRRASEEEARTELVLKYLRERKARIRADKKRLAALATSLARLAKAHRNKAA